MATGSLKYSVKLRRLSCTHATLFDVVGQQMKLVALACGSRCTLCNVDCINVVVQLHWLLQRAIKTRAQELGCCKETARFIHPMTLRLPFIFTCYVDIDIYYYEIVHCLTEACKRSIIPRLKVSALKHYWNSTTVYRARVARFAHIYTVILL